MIEGHRGGRDLSFHRASLAYLLLDQRLGPLQLAGVALVVCAVVLVEGVKLRRG